MDTLYPYLPGFLLAYSVFALAMCSPGPNVLTIMGTSMSVGRTEGMALALGTAIGSSLWAVLTVVGLTALIATYAWILVAIKIAGGVFLLWLGFKSFKSAATVQDIKARSLEANQSLMHYGMRGFTVQMTNPKAALFWVATAALALKTGAPWWVSGLFIIGIFFLSLIGHQFYALAFSTNVMVRTYGRARRGIQLVLGSFFTLAGFKLLLSRSS